MLKNKLQGLTALPCLLCGRGKLCSCLDTCRNPQDNDGTITPPTPSQGLLDECFRDGVLDGSDEDDPESASRVAAHWRLYNTLGSDLSKPSKRVEYQLWRSLQPWARPTVEAPEQTYEKHPDWWPPTPECGPEASPKGDLAYDFSLLP